MSCSPCSRRVQAIGNGVGSGVCVFIGVAGILFCVLYAEKLAARGQLRKHADFRLGSELIKADALFGRPESIYVREAIVHLGFLEIRLYLPRATEFLIVGDATGHIEAGVASIAEFTTRGLYLHAVVVIVQIVHARNCQHPRYTCCCAKKKTFHEKRIKDFNPAGQETGGTVFLRSGE